VCVRVMLWEAELSCTDWRGVDAYSNGQQRLLGNLSDACWYKVVAGCEEEREKLCSGSVSGL
jgi:hypothetical protein